MDGWMDELKMNELEMNELEMNGLMDRLGVTKANLDDSLITCEFVVFGLVYYIISFGDSYLNIYPSDNNSVEIARFVLTSS